MAVAGEMSSVSPQVTATGAALRVPLLSFNVLLDWTSGTTAAGAPATELSAALVADRAHLTLGLSQLFEDARLQASLRIAAPTVYEEMRRWQEQGGQPSSRLRRTLVSYLSRAGGRATPFGTFAACGRLRLGPTTNLVMAEPAARPRRSSLDFGLLEAIVQSLASEPDVRDQMVVQPNSTIYRMAGRLRYAVSSVDSEGVRRHHLAATVATRPLEIALEIAATGPVTADLRNRLARKLTDEGLAVTRQDVARFVEDMIEGQLLVPSVSPAVTGQQQPAATLAGLPDVPQGRSTREFLTIVDALLREADNGDLAELPGRLDAIERRIGQVSQERNRAHLVRVDTGLAMDELTLARTVADDLARVIHLVAGLGSRHVHELSAFRGRFRARYESAAVPLLAALDAESGIGYGSRGPATAALSPLLATISFPKPQPAHAFHSRDGVRLTLLSEALLGGHTEILLDPGQLEPLRDGDVTLPEAYHVFGTLCAASTEAVDAGDYTFLLKDVDGPAGVSLLGRFAALEQGLLELVRDQVAVEELLHPARLFAEIVHLPEGRTGNVIARPHLRQHEIAFLGTSGLPQEQQITLSDLTVSLVGDRIVLRSDRLDREVVPRLTTAHNFTDGSLDLYRFLCDLQYQDADACGGWDWGPLMTSAFLPRVSLGRFVLSRARWRVEPAEAQNLRRQGGETRRWLAFQDLRQRRRLPRWVVLAEHDNELVLDLENVLCVEVLLGRLHLDAPTTLIELFPGPDDLCLFDASGHRFVHEVVVTCRTAGAVPERKPASAAASAPRPAAAPWIERRFGPGSPWLYLRLYGGEALADDVLTGPLADFTADLTDRAIVDSWFFLRYRDEESHLRIRWHTQSGDWTNDVVQRLKEITDEALEEGLLHRVEVATYEREVERYGGPSGIDIAEQIFAIDSAATTAILQMDDGDALTELRGRAAVVGTDRLLADFGLSLDERLAWARTTATALQAEFGGGTDLTHSLGSRFRARRPELTAILDRDRTDGLADVLAERSRCLAPLIETLHARADRGMLTSTVAELTGSYVHMYLNRLLRSDQRASEMVVADWLQRIYRTQAARESS